MAFNIQNFIGNINRYGTLQTNRYEITLLPPQVLGTVATSQRLTYRAESVSIPGVVIDSTDVRRYGIGPREKYGTNVSFSDVGISFIEEDGNNIHKYMYRWMNAIFGFAGSSFSSSPSYAAEYKSRYSTSMDIKVFNNSQQVTEIINLQGVFPTGLSEISLGWADNNQLFKVKASFAYTRWQLVSSNEVTNSPESIGTAAEAP
jgi:hypothetical protein